MNVEVLFFTELVVFLLLIVVFILELGYLLFPHFCLFLS